MRIFLFLLLFMVSLSAMVLGNIVSTKGVVKVKKGDGFRKIKAKDGMKVYNGDLVLTSENSYALVELIDKSKIVLDSSSSLYFKKKNTLEQFGKIFYKITSRSAKNSLKIKTPFAIIGIKGTTFIVENAQDSYVLLKEGLIGVESVKEEFRLYRVKAQQEFDKFSAKKEEELRRFASVEEAELKKFASMQQKEFATFEDEKNKYLPLLITKSFDLKSGNKIFFQKDRVNEDKMNFNDDSEFDYFQELIKKMHY